MKSFVGLFTILCIVVITSAILPVKPPVKLPPVKLPLDTCYLPSVTGPCKAAIKRYFYNTKTGACETFTYGGCGGNSNNYKTKLECQQKCNKHVCSQPKEVGPCLALFPRFFYNKVTGLCQKFTFGGCHGNANNFKTKQECLAVCKRAKGARKA